MVSVIRLKELIGHNRLYSYMKLHHICSSLWLKMISFTQHHEIGLLLENCLISL